jgi:bifunctional DNase/RNase
VAVRMETPLFVSDELMESEGIILTLEGEDDEEDTPDELVGQFRQFLDSVRPEDFDG